MFDFSKKYEENVKVSAIIVWLLSLVVFGVYALPQDKPESFVMWAPETNQPNCVVGGYIMLAKERLNSELTVKQLQTLYPTLTNNTVSFGTITAFWKDMYPSNKLICNYDPEDTNWLSHKIQFGKPYLWVGNWTANTNYDTHVCLVYFQSNSVAFKHFVYDPKKGFNYWVKTNYDFFFSRTIRVYDVKMK